MKTNQKIKDGWLKENETKKTDNDNKTAETASADILISACEWEAMRQLGFGLKEFKNICYQSWLNGEK